MEEITYEDLDNNLAGIIGQAALFGHRYQIVHRDKPIAVIMGYNEYMEMQRRLDLAELDLDQNLVACSRHLWEQVGKEVTIDYATVNWSEEERSI